MEKEVVDYDYKSQILEDRKSKIGVGEVFNEDHFLKNKPVWIQDTFRTIDGFCMGVQTGVKRAFLQTYVRYTHREKMFAKVITSRERLFLYLRLDYKDLTQKPVFIRDYTPVAKQKFWIELSFTEPELLKNETILFDATQSLIKQSFQRILKNPQLSKFPSFGKKQVIPEFVNSRKLKFDVELGSDGFVDLKLRCHKIQLPKLLEKLME